MKSIFSLVRTSLKLGWDNCLAIVVHRFFIFTGYYKRCLPLATCPIPELIKDVPNIVSSQTEWEDQARSSCLIEADRLLDGHIKYFGKYFHKVGTPPLWFIDPLNGQNFCESSIHWTHCKIFKSFDIKRVWEASRWTWAPLFARAWRYTGQDIYIDVLNEWIKDWSIKNYFCGAPNWMCGQEVAIRLLHALQAWQIIESPRKIPKLSKGRKKFVELHLRRIDLTTRYAKAQQNNHWVSEAAALFIAGHWLTLFSDQKDFDANYFAQKGRQSLERSVGELLLQDGSFSQNSLTYHRLLLDTLIQVELWRIRFQLPEFSHAFKKRCYFATKWLKAFVDPITGDGPNLGHNDGALCYKFDNLSYRDFRSTLQLASVLFLGEKCLPQGPWDESFNWIDINLEVNKKTKEPFPCLQYFSDGGYALLRPNQKTWALFRLPKYKFRPAHADPLHIDLWNNGENILRDGGSYSYNSNENDMTYFSGIASHNSLQVDDKEPMTRLSRFLWGDWLKLDSQPEMSEDANTIIVNASYSSRGVRHQRYIKALKAQKIFIVNDCITGNYDFCLLRWRFCNADWKLNGNELISSKARIVINSDMSIDVINFSNGWESRYYGNKIKIPVLTIRFSKKTSNITTEFSLLK